MDKEHCDKFWLKVDKISSPNGCWIWIASKFRSGYGQFGYNGTMCGSHRISWELHNGPIPDGLMVLHNCPGGDNRACVNPDHLWLGDNSDNMRDRNVKGRQAKGEAQGNSKLLEGDVAIIRHLCDNKDRFCVTQQEIADMFSISHAQVSNIARNSNWSHIHG